MPLVDIGPLCGFSGAQQKIPRDLATRTDSQRDGSDVCPKKGNGGRKLDVTSAERGKTLPSEGAALSTTFEDDLLGLEKIPIEARMATLPKLPERSPEWSAEAMAMAAQAKVLSGSKLEQLVVRLQRHTGRPKEACWRFIIQYGIKGQQDHRRWTETEFEIVREELVKRSIEEVARKLNRTPKAIRNMLNRNDLNLREIRCDLFSVESLAIALHVRKAEVIFWIEQGWLQASIVCRGKRRSYTITPEALMSLYKHHHADVLKRGIPNQALFEAYVQYCFSPKHTVGEQLLDVRRDKRERAAYAAAGTREPDDDEEEGEEGQDADDEESYRGDMEGSNGTREDSRIECE